MTTERAKKVLCGNSASHARLINICTYEFAQEQLSPLPPHKVEMARAVALANIRHNRVCGLLSRHKPANIRAWLANYLRQISFCLETQREQWARFRNDPRNPELMALLERYVNSCTSNCSDRIETLSLAYYEIQIKLTEQYPFDAPLQEWVRNIVERAYFTVRFSGGSSRVIRFADGAQQDFDTLEMLPADGYESQPEWWSDRLDLQTRISHLKLREQKWLRQRIAGNTNAQIAQAHGVSEKTVLNGMRLIGLQLGIVQKRT